MKQTKSVDHQFLIHDPAATPAEPQPAESVLSASYYLKGGAVILATGAAYAVAKTTGALSWLWSGIEAYITSTAVLEDKAVQPVSSAVQDFAETDPLLISPLKSSTSSVSSRRIEEFDSLDLVEIDREMGKTASNPVTSKKVPGDESEVIHLDTQKGLRVPHESRYVGRRLLMTPDAEFIVNTYTAGNQYDPAVAASPNGGFVLTWTSNGEDGSGDGVYAQVFNASAMRASSEFRANTYTAGNQDQPAIAMSDNASFYISWASNQDVDLGVKSK